MKAIIVFMGSRRMNNLLSRTVKPIGKLWERTPISFDPNTCEHLEICRTHPEYDEHVPICRGCIKDNRSEEKVIKCPLWTTKYYPKCLHLDNETGWCHRREGICDNAIKYNLQRKV